MSQTSPNNASTIDDWELYPEGSQAFDPFEYDALELRDRFNKQAPLIFSEKDTSIDFIDASCK